MYYLVGKHRVPRQLNARSFFRYESFSSTQAAPSNVLTESMALLARIAKCEVRNIYIAIALGTLIVISHALRKFVAVELQLQLYAIFERISAGNQTI